MELLECRLQRQFIAYSRKLGWWFLDGLPFWREQSMKTRNQQQISPISSSRSNRQSGQSIRNNPHFINEIINQLLTPAIWFLIELLNAGLNFKIDLSQIVWALATFELAAQFVSVVVGMKPESFHAPNRPDSGFHQQLNQMAANQTIRL